MIAATTDSSFLRYGTIVEEMPEQEISLEKAHTVALYRMDRATVWSSRSDMTILLIRDGGQLRFFYLDRIVAIEPGVEFGFFPIFDSSVICGEPGLDLAAAVCDRIETPVPSQPIQPIRLFTFFNQQAEEGFYFRGEQHSPFELVYMEKGCLHNYCGGQDLALRTGELLLIAPEQWHIQYADEAVQFVTISFLWSRHDFEGLTNTVIRATPAMQRCILEMKQESMHPQPESSEYMHAQLKLLLLAILRQPDPETGRKRQLPAAEQAQKAVLDKALQIISTHIGEAALTVPKLAAEVHVSPTQLSNLFQKYIGIAPAKYMTRIRLEECKLLLAEGKLSIGEIANQMGYSSIQHFSKQFRQWVGCTPSTYARTYHTVGGTDLSRRME